MVQMAIIMVPTMSETILLMVREAMTPTGMAMVQTARSSKFLHLQKRDIDSTTTIGVEVTETDGMVDGQIHIDRMFTYPGRGTEVGGIHFRLIRGM